jgi:hypothetical protein
MQPGPRVEGNIGEGPQNARMRGGVIAFVVAIAVSVVLVRSGLHPALRLLLLVPFFVAANGVYMGLFGA